MNSRQTNFLAEMQRIADINAQLYSCNKLYQQQWQEEFVSGKDNALDTEDFSQYNFTYNNVLQFINNNITQAITFWDGGGTLPDLERGKFSRRIMGGNRHLI